VQLFSHGHSNGTKKPEADGGRVGGEWIAEIPGGTKGRIAGYWENCKCTRTRLRVCLATLCCTSIWDTNTLEGYQLVGGMWWDNNTLR